MINWLTLPVVKPRLSRAHYAQLADDASLTRRVRAACSGHFEVELITRKKVKPNRQERTLLNLSDSASALSRQVFLCCYNQPLIFARTIIGLVDKNRALVDRITVLGEQSLGSILFEDPHAIKRQMLVARIPLDHAFFKSVDLSRVSADEELWVRQSLYDYEGCYLIVYEAFITFFEGQ